MRKIGGAWIHKTKEGKTFLSGNIDLITSKIKIGLFKIENKKNPKGPDYDIVVMNDMPQKEQIKTEKISDL